MFEYNKSNSKFKQQNMKRINNLKEWDGEWGIVKVIQLAFLAGATFMEQFWAAVSGFVRFK